MTAKNGALLMQGLGVMGTRGQHVNVPQHLTGLLKNHLSSEDKQELLGLIENYHQGLVPLIVPLLPALTASIPPQFGYGPPHLHPRAATVSGAPVPGQITVLAVQR